jgi:hypothetical protein
MPKYLAKKTSAECTVCRRGNFTKDCQNLANGSNAAVPNGYLQNVANFITTGGGSGVIIHDTTRVAIPANGSVRYITAIYSLDGGEGSNGGFYCMEITSSKAVSPCPNFGSIRDGTPADNGWAITNWATDLMGGGKKNRMHSYAIAEWEDILPGPTTRCLMGMGDEGMVWGMTFEGRRPAVGAACDTVRQ